MSQYRAGPWPGLTPRGAGVVLACAVFLAIGQVLVGTPDKPLPDLPVLGATSLLPLIIALRIVGAPGAASAVCGTYLLPRSLVSLLVPSIPPPPLLLVASIALDLTVWLEPAHLADLRDLLPWPRHVWRTRQRPSSASASLSRGRALVGGAVYGAALGLVEPAYRAFLGADPSRWPAAETWTAAILTSLVCAALATVTSVPSVRGTAS